MHTTKIATCCYCGTRAALVFDAGRHELICQTCGAPLHEMKTFPMHSGSSGYGKSAPKKKSAPTQLRQFDHVPETKKKREKPHKKYKEKSRESAGWEKQLRSLSKHKFSKKVSKRKILGKIWDAVEDIFD